VDDESEAALWEGDEELGVEPHIKERYSNQDIMDMKETGLLGEFVDMKQAETELLDATRHPQPGIRSPESRTQGCMPCPISLRSHRPTVT
jgi:hypothetical protein